jgi:hypothetical protein
MAAVGTLLFVVFIPRSEGNFCSYTEAEAERLQTQCVVTLVKVWNKIFKTGSDSCSVNWSSFSQVLSEAAR